MAGYIYIALTIMFTLYGQLILKWRITTLDVQMPDSLWAKILQLVYLLFDPLIFSGLLAAFLASLAWMGAMTKLELSFAYPFMALNFVFVLIFGVVLLGENLTVGKVVGLGFIVLGTVVTAKC